MSLSILNNIPSLSAQNQLSVNSANLSKTLFRLSSGSRINSGADDAAGLAIADGLHANVTALNQSARNANDGVGQLQVADGALAQVTSLLNRGVTLATEASTGTVTDAQRVALNAEFTSIKAEVDRIGTSTTFNGTAVFSATTTSVYLSDSGTSSSIGTTTGTLSQSSIGDGNGNTKDLSANTLSDATHAQASLTALNGAISNVASLRGTIGANINRLNAASTVITAQVQNLSAAEDGIRGANIAEEVANLSKFQILNSTGISALSQANQSQQSVLRLLQ
jgi:flagellin